MSKTNQKNNIMCLRRTFLHQQPRCHYWPGCSDGDAAPWASVACTWACTWLAPGLHQACTRLALGMPWLPVDGYGLQCFVYEYTDGSSRPRPMRRLV